MTDLKPGELSEKEICQKLDVWFREGLKGRLDCTKCPYIDNTIAYTMYCYGWVHEDIYQSLKKARALQATKVSIYE